MSFRSVSEFYEAYAEYVADLEERAGVPRPCPKCGAYVEICEGANPAVNEGKFWVECSMCFSVQDGRYETSLYDTAEDAWREHEANCQAAEEGEG